MISYLSAHPNAKMTRIAEYLLLGLSNLTAIVDKLVGKEDRPAQPLRRRPAGGAGVSDR